jgi:hypothetical protein
MSKKLLALTLIGLILNGAIVVGFMFYGTGKVNSGEYLTSKVLDTALPINVSIDTEFLSRFN